MVVCLGRFTQASEVHEVEQNRSATEDLEGVQGLGRRVWGLGFRISLGFRVLGVYTALTAFGIGEAPLKTFAAEGFADFGEEQTHGVGSLGIPRGFWISWLKVPIEVGGALGFGCRTVGKDAIQETSVRLGLQSR